MIPEHESARRDVVECWLCCSRRGNCGHLVRASKLYQVSIKKNNKEREDKREKKKDKSILYTVMQMALKIFLLNKRNQIVKAI